MESFVNGRLPTTLLRDVVYDENSMGPRTPHKSLLNPERVESVLIHWKLLIR